MIDQWMGYKRVHVQYIFGQIQLNHLLSPNGQFMTIFTPFLGHWRPPAVDGACFSSSHSCRFSSVAALGPAGCVSVCVCCKFWAVCVWVCVYMSCHGRAFCILCIMPPCVNLKNNKCVCVCARAAVCLRVCLCACTDLRCSSFGTFENMAPQYPWFIIFPTNNKNVIWKVCGYMYIFHHQNHK